MTISKQSNISNHQSYCLNVDCQQPENPRDAVICKSCNSPLILHQSYRAIKPIGRGGFGRTFLAIAASQNPESQQSESYCVIKQFFPQQQGNMAKASELFRQEAERLKTLGNHAQIPKLLDYFEDQLTSDKQPTGNLYLVQEFIDGRNLAQELAEEGVFDENKIRELLESLLPILAFIHSHQVIHRDIKPENIVRRSAQIQGGKEELVLVDFGSAKYATETKLAKTGTMIGSAAYTAPEQVLGKADFSSDIYSLGVTCIHLLTGISPFSLFDSKEHTWIWRDYLRLVEKENHQKSPSTSSIDNLPLSEHLGQILDRMLQSATNKRFKSASAVIEALNLRSQPEVILKLKRRIKPKWLVIGTMLILGFGTVRAATIPVTQMVASNYRVVPELVTDRPDSRDDLPNVGGLYSADDKQVFPLKHTEVMAKVAGNVSRVEVTQTFNNPLKQPLEAIYVFPLPDQAAVDDMEIKVGDRTIRGFIKKREEAKQIFDEAKRAGKTAGLLEQERDNIFTQSLANIKPGETIEVKIRYTESLKFEKGSYEFVFPMVVGPRYIPSNVADANKINPPIQSQLSISRSGQDIGVTVEIEAGVPLSNLKSTSHQIRTIQNGGVTRVTLDPQDTIPNKDLILRYQVSGNDTQNTVLVQADRRGGHFATYLIPALKYQSDRIVPKDVIFLMDTSGSQSGEPLAQSKQLMYRFIKGLNPNDTFTIIDFSNIATQLSALPLENTQSNRDRAKEYVDRLEANGGTELMNGIEAVLKFPAAKEGRLRSIVLLTDGYIGNDEQIIGEVRDRLKAGNRLYTFGVGSSVNRFLIERLSQLGRGTAQVVRQDEPVAPVVEEFFQQINNPVLTNIAVKWEGSGTAPEMYPARPSDLFANQPLVLFGRKGDRTSGNLQITGMAAGGKPYAQTIPVNFTAEGNMAIAQLWGRARIQELMNQMYNIETSDGIAAVTKTALEYNLLSKYTAFVAVTDEVRVEPKLPTATLNVPVPNPQGVINPANIVPTTLPTTTANANLNDEEVPEPEQIFGTLAGILLLIGALLRKRLSSNKNPR